MRQRRPHIRVSAPIVPNQSLGGLTLRSHVTDLQELLEDTYITNEGTDSWYRLTRLVEARFAIPPIELAIDIRTGMLFRLTAMEGYERGFGAIRIGMRVEEAMTLEAGLYYEDVDEVLVLRGVEGISFDLDQEDLKLDEVRSASISAISVFAAEAVRASGTRWGGVRETSSAPGE